MAGPIFESVFEAEKVFCIGLSKTGTTSLEQALKDLGYRLGAILPDRRCLPGCPIFFSLHLSRSRSEFPKRKVYPFGAG